MKYFKTKEDNIPLDKARTTKVPPSKTLLEDNRPVAQAHSQLQLGANASVQKKDKGFKTSLKPNALTLIQTKEKHAANTKQQVLQQKSKLVTTEPANTKSVFVNDDKNLETEADQMGYKASQLKGTETNDKSLTQTNTSHSLQLKPVTQLTTEKIEAKGLTTKMGERFHTACDTMISKVIGSSFLATGSQNQVVFHGISKNSFSTVAPHYGSTNVYIGTNGYKGSNYDQFTDLFLHNPSQTIPSDVSFRVVITLNLSVNKTIEELYTTLLHEWHVHAEKWEPILQYIRNNSDGHKEVDKIQKTGSATREDAEHQNYANWKDSEAENKVDQLNLNTLQSDKVKNKLKNDIKRYDKVTGKLI